MSAGYARRSRTEFDSWRARDLSGIELDYFFADGSYFKMHPGAPAEPVLVAWGITTSAKPVFLGMEPGANESTDAWAGFFRGLKAGACGDPLLVISDGGKGLIGALDDCVLTARSAKDASSTGPATSWPRCPLTPRPR